MKILFIYKKGVFMKKNIKFKKETQNNNYSHIGILSKIVIVILVIGMILGHFNLGIIAKAFEEKDHIIITDNIKSDFSQMDNIDEVETLRTENTKTFIKDNGMYETSYYGEKIHYYKNNEWIEIDNTLKVKDNKYHNRIRVRRPFHRRGRAGKPDDLRRGADRREPAGILRR